MFVTTLTPAVYKPWARRERVLAQSCPTLRPHGCSLPGSSCGACEKLAYLLQNCLCHDLTFVK